MGNSGPLRAPAWETIDKGVLKRYAIDKRIGRGCYGVVWSCQAVVQNQKKEPANYAIKKILHCFKNSDEARRTYREVNYLMEFSEHDNIIKIKDVMCSADDQHLYLVFELMASDLQKALRVRALQKVHRCYVTYQMLRALKYIHSAGIMHRDVKPANILITNTCETRLTDFGWAREAPCAGDGLMTDYAASRWYRAPEMLLGGLRYTTAIDMWAAGCIAGEMYNNGAALIPGTSTIDMLDKIIEYTGKPSEGDIISMQAPRAQQSLDPVPSQPPYSPIESVFPGESAEFHDFIELLIQWNPEKRLTATEALSHPFLACFHDPDCEPTFGRRVCLEIHDGTMLTANRYRDLIYADAIGIEAAKTRVALDKTKDLQNEADNV